jgi:hypothetical protein
MGTCKELIQPNCAACKHPAKGYTLCCAFSGLDCALNTTMSSVYAYATSCGVCVVIQCTFLLFYIATTQKGNTSTDISSS